MMSLSLLRLPMVIIAYLLYMITELMSAFSDKPKKEQLASLVSCNLLAKRAIYEFNYWNILHEMVLHRAKNNRKTHC